MLVLWLIFFAGFLFCFSFLKIRRGNAADRFPAMSFDIHDVAPSQRCDALLDAIDRAYYPCETRFLTDLHRGRMRCVEVGPVRMGYGDVDPMRVDRSPAMLRRAAGDYVFLPLPLREGIRLSQRGRRGRGWTTERDRIESVDFSIEFLDQFRKFHGFFLKNCKISGIFSEFGHF